MIQYFIILSCSILSALFATAVMSYIAMAVPIGPWIEATLVLLLSILLNFFSSRSKKVLHKSIALATAAGGIAGIVATGCAFSFPTLYFLDKPLFNEWLSNPLYFSFILAGLVFLAGSFGLMFAQLLKEQFIERPNLTFPVGIMIQKIIHAGDQVQRKYSLILGGISALIFLIVQKPIFWGRSIIPRALVLSKRFPVSIPFLNDVSFFMPQIIVQCSLLPLLVSVGFIAGHMITVPLIIGAISQIALKPINSYFFAAISWRDFIFAFCSGLVLQGVIVSFFSISKLFRSIKTNSFSFDTPHKVFTKPHLFAGGLFLAFYFSFMSFIKIPFLAQLFLLIGSLICTYQLCLIGGKIGLAPLGRFATFIMVPGVLFFGALPIMATVLAMFVEVAGGVAVDALFSYKTGNLLKIDNKEMRRAQWLGLIVAACSIGLIFYFLITHFGLGSEKLFAQKAQTRALLLNVTAFNVSVLFGGFLFGLILKWLGFNPVFVLTGMLMPFDYSLGLILGGIIGMYLNKDDQFSSFFSGVFCINSLWIILEAFFLR